MIELLLNYWQHLIIGTSVIVGLIFFVLNQRKNIKEWLLYAVIEAEKKLGSKTGKIKLRQVYDDFIQVFPIISKLIPFETFSKLVDLALDEMREILNTNENCKLYVENGKVIEDEH